MKHTTLILPCSIVFLLFISVKSQKTPAVGFSCTSNITCQAIAGYVPQNSTTIEEIKKLFDVKSLHKLLSANNLPSSTDKNYSIQANTVFRVPFSCKCNNGSGYSDGSPLYTVIRDDGLDAIARFKFSALVTYQQIAVVNSISNPDKIEPGDKLKIPLPCSCDAVDGNQVVHLAHIVAPGSSVQQIGTQFGWSEDTLLKVNPSVVPKNLLAGTVLDVPLKVCNSTINSTSLDRSLLVPNGSYEFTAHNCIKCSCNSADFQLRCEPAQGVIKLTSWKQCPALTCSNTNMTIGNVTTISSCEETACLYAGYNNASVFTLLANRSTCPASAPSPGSSAARAVTTHGFCRIWLLLCVLGLSFLF